MTTTLTSSSVTGNAVTAGNGGNGGTGHTSSVGGDGGSVHGGGLYLSNSSLTLNTLSVNSNSAVAGSGGTGGLGFGGGSNGGAGGSGDGGGISFNNTSALTVNLALNDSTISTNQLLSGAGGNGGNAGPSGTSFIVAGSGGNGGSVQGGGIFLSADAVSVTASSFTNSSLSGNIITSANGGTGGDGSSNRSGPAVGTFASGGNGGNAEGGALYNDSFNTVTATTLNITGATFASNVVTTGFGGNGGTGTSANGGPGGNGGSGGNAEGGALFEGDNTNLTVINSTFGGPSASASSPTLNSNTLAAGQGGAGGDAGTPAGQPNNNGGNGGNGGTVQGGAIYVNSGGAEFLNVTIASNEALGGALGGPGGAGTTSTGGLNGTPGVAGGGFGGGYFAAGGTNEVGNSIIALNAAGTDPDVSGSFASLGHNIIGNVGAAVGFISHDQTGISAAQLNLAPLGANGGPTATDALQPGSVAINNGDDSLVPSGITFDQRGTPFLRIVDNVVDVGAFELQTVSPPSPPGPPSPLPPGVSSGTTTVITGFHNSYPGFAQIETVSAQVTSNANVTVNEGFVTFAVNDITLTAPVVNGFANVTFNTPFLNALFDFMVLINLFFPHTLTASYSDPGGVFGPSSASISVPGMLVDFFDSIIAAEGLQQFQLI